MAMTSATEWAAKFGLTTSTSGDAPVSAMPEKSLTGSIVTL